MESVIFAGMDVNAWMPLMTSLSRQNVAFENLFRMTPLLDSEPATSGVFLVVGRASHDFCGKTHFLPGRHKLLRLQKLCMLNCSLQHFYLVISTVAN